MSLYYGEELGFFLSYQLAVHYNKSKINLHLFSEGMLSHSYRHFVSHTCILSRTGVSHQF